MITAAQFKLATGRDPEQDDLERVNCDKAGHITHQCCGWCGIHDKPVFECLYLHINPMARYIKAETGRNAE